MAFWKDSMINRLSNIINRNRSAAKISQVLCSSARAHKLHIWYPPIPLRKSDKTNPSGKRQVFLVQKL